VDPRQKLKDLAVSDSGFVFDPYTAATYTVNPTGLVILEALKDGLERDDLIARIGDRFDVGAEDLHRDVDEFLHLLRSYGVVAHDFSI